MAAAAPEQSSQSAASAPVAPEMQEALRRFSDTLYTVQDSLTEGQYLQLNNDAKLLFDAKRQSSTTISTQLDGVRQQVANHLALLHDEVDSYRNQLTSATVTIDNLRSRRDQYARRLSVVESLVLRLGGSTKMLDTEFELFGLLSQADFERDRKRRRSASPTAEGGASIDGEVGEESIAARGAAVSMVDNGSDESDDEEGSCNEKESEEGSSEPSHVSEI